MARSRTLVNFLFEQAPPTLADGSAAGKPVILGGNLPCPGRGTV